MRLFSCMRPNMTSLMLKPMECLITERAFIWPWEVVSDFASRCVLGVRDDCERGPNLAVDHGRHGIIHFRDSHAFDGTCKLRRQEGVYAMWCSTVQAKFKSRARGAGNLLATRTNCLAPQPIASQLVSRHRIAGSYMQPRHDINAPRASCSLLLRGIPRIVRFAGQIVSQCIVYTSFTRIGSLLLSYLYIVVGKLS